MKSSKTCVAKSTPSHTLSAIPPAPKTTERQLQLSSIVISNLQHCHPQRSERSWFLCVSSTIKPCPGGSMKSVLTLLALCILATASFAQEHPAITALPNSVYVG